MPYTNLDSAVCTDELMGDLIDEDPSLGALWLLLLGASQPWGRFPANVKRLKAEVCPMVDRFTGDALQALVDRLVKAGRIVRYTCYKTGTPCIAIRNHARYNGRGRQFHRLGVPKWSPEPDWEPPEALLDYLQDVQQGKFRGKDLHKECEKFGVCPLVVPGSTPKDQSGGILPNARGDVETLRREKGVTTNDNDLLPESADGALPAPAIDPPPADPPAAKQTRKQRKAQTDADAEAAIALARADLPPGCMDLVETLMDLFAQENKTGRMALTREATLTAELAEKCKRDGIGTDALRHGLTAAIGKGAANVNYVIKAANGWVPGADRPSSNGKLFVTCSDGSKLWEDSPNWGLSQELGVAEAKAEGIWNQRTGCTTVPSRGFCCDDGWYYDSRDDGSMYQARRWGQ